MIDSFNDKTNFPHKSLLIDRQVSRLRKAFSNNSSANLKLSKTQLYKIVQLVEFLGFLLTKSVLKPLGKNVLILLGLTGVSAADARIHKKKISNRE